MFIVDTSACNVNLNIMENRANKIVHVIYIVLLIKTRGTVDHNIKGTYIKFNYLSDVVKGEWGIKHMPGYAGNMLFISIKITFNCINQ